MRRPDASLNSPTIVLDSSALLAFLQLEPGSARVAAALLDGAAISTVNLAEVYTKLVATGRPVSTNYRKTARRRTVRAALYRNGRLCDREYGA